MARRIFPSGNAPRNPPSERSKPRTNACLGAESLFHLSRSRLHEPVRCICITSCRFCISFGCNTEVTHADVLKMIFPASPWTSEKRATNCFFRPWPRSTSRLWPRLQNQDLPMAALLAVRWLEALRDARPQALFRQTPRSHLPAGRGTAFSEMTLFNFGAFR